MRFSIGYLVLTLFCPSTLTMILTLSSPLGFFTSKTASMWSGSRGVARSVFLSLTYVAFFLTSRHFLISFVDIPWKSSTYLPMIAESMLALRTMSLKLLSSMMSLCFDMLELFPPGPLIRGVLQLVSYTSPRPLTIYIKGVCMRSGIKQSRGCNSGSE